MLASVPDLSAEHGSFSATVVAVSIQGVVLRSQGFSLVPISCRFAPIDNLRNDHYSGVQRVLHEAVARLQFVADRCVGRQEAGLKHSSLAKSNLGGESLVHLSALFHSTRCSSRPS